MRRYLSLIACLCLLSACETKEKERFSGPLQGYDLAQPYVLKLPLALDEISGLAYVPSDRTLLAINDEHGILYKLDVRQPRYIRQWRFGPTGDYEGVAVADSFVFVLRSDGHLFQLDFPHPDTLRTREFAFPQTGNEFESLTFLPQTRELLLICKDCADDAKEEFSWFRFHVDSLKFTEYRYRFPTERIEAYHNYKRKRFKPSGVALHPLTGHLYIISAVNKALVVVDPRMQVTEVVSLPEHLFLQPEGIDFDNAGNMFISNESDDVHAANILIFPYRLTTRP